MRPFKIITPSWVIPGTYLENLKFLSDKKDIDGVELLFFLFDDDIRADFLRELDQIRKFGERFIFTAHLPDNLLPEHGNLIEILAPFVKHFIVHPPCNTDFAPNLAKTLLFWMEKYGRERFVIENTKINNLKSLLNCFDACQLPLCMDTGHLLLEGLEPADYAATNGRVIKEIHLHGIDKAAAATDGCLPDHRSVISGTPWFNTLIPFLRRFTGIINIEVFSWAQAEVSLKTLLEA